MYLWNLYKQKISVILESGVNVMKKFILLIVLFQVMTFGAESKLLESIDKSNHYRCEIIDKYNYLRELSIEFGNILLNENYINIFLASEDLAETLVEMKRELESIDVPDKMKEPHDVFLKSTELYRDSAYYVHLAMGITLRRYKGSTIEVQQLINLAEDRVKTANTYLIQSLDLHEKLFIGTKLDSFECMKYIADF